MRFALTRAVSPAINECELTHRERSPIDVRRAALEHDEYEKWLVAHGCEIVRVAPLPHLPDGVFVEDTVVVLDEIAVLTHPGAESRRGELDTVAAALRRFRGLMQIEPPGTLDGGDVLRIGRTLYVGRSPRTNDEGIVALRTIVSPFAWDVVAVDFSGCLHLKSAVTLADDNTVLYNPEFVDAAAFAPRDAIAVDPSEPSAGNVLRLGDTTLMSASYPLTRRILEAAGIRSETVEMSELEKAEAGVTCSSVIFEA